MLKLRSSLAQNWIEQTKSITGEGACWQPQRRQVQRSAASLTLSSFLTLGIAVRQIIVLVTIARARKTLLHHDRSTR
jgi:hypothetical protein